MSAARVMFSSGVGSTLSTLAWIMFSTHVRIEPTGDEWIETAAHVWITFPAHAWIVTAAHVLIVAAAHVLIVAAAHVWILAAISTLMTVMSVAVVCDGKVGQQPFSVQVAIDLAHILPEMFSVDSAQMIDFFHHVRQIGRIVSQDVLKSVFRAAQMLIMFARRSRMTAVMISPGSQMPR
jgi:hypothetical protein